MTFQQAAQLLDEHLKSKAYTGFNDFDEAIWLFMPHINAIAALEADNMIPIVTDILKELRP